MAGDPDGSYFRRVGESSLASAVFNIWFLYPDSTYAVRLCYRSPGGPASVDVFRGELRVGSGTLPESDSWNEVQLPVSGDVEEEGAPAQDESAAATSRWAGTASLMIGSVRLLDADGAERAIFTVGEPLIVEVDVVARESGVFPLIPAALTFRADGVVATRHLGPATELEVRQGEHVTARLELGDLLLGNGTYLLSVGLYSTLDIDDLEPAEFYDYFDRSFEFNVVGNPRLHNELVRHPGHWTITPAVAGERPSKEAISSCRLRLFPDVRRVARASRVESLALGAALGATAPSDADPTA
jgi:hypothetical protein